MKKIGNLTQHLTTPEQEKSGVVEPGNKKNVKDLLTFKKIPDLNEINEVAASLTAVAASEGWKIALVGGAPYLISALEKKLISAGIVPCYAFSERDSVDKTLADGSVVKTNVFKHKGFIFITLDI